MTTVVRLELVPDHHTAPVCPPNQDAECANCGYRLEHHQGDVPEVGARCPHEYSGEVFVPVATDDLDCPGLVTCDPCGVQVCEHHSDDLTTVGAHTHHSDCAMACGDCRGPLRELSDAGWFQ